MATGVGMGFDLSGLDKKLKQADTQLTQLMQKMNTLSQTSINAFKKIATQGVEPVIDDLVRQRKELEALSKIKGGGGMTEIKREARASIKEIDKVIKLLQRASQKQGNPQIAIQDLGTPKGALEYARGLSSGVKSINTMNLALQRLRIVQADLNRNTSDGRKKYAEISKEIEKIEKELAKVQEKKRGLLDTSGQLARAMAAVFSVSAIKGYVNKLIQIRGEFDLQQRSLQVLLQNKHEADVLWEKTVALAVKSPYTTKELVTATKQLAAYRIESEKLYETQKMLSDVSSGLGVDVQRLILAFGQVKAAGFLRGTELRQFSEAGVNMLDELSKRFTALEGRAVSVGEVFERVSKRMVSFTDVEEVFKSLTSEGGIFYKMQEKQADTVKGMMLNLRDSYELMLNDIGKSHDAAIKNILSSLKAIISNWEMFMAIAEPMIVMLIARWALFSATILGTKGGFIGFVSTALSGLKKLQQALKASTSAAEAFFKTFSMIGGGGGKGGKGGKAGGYAAIIMAIITVIWAAVEAYQAWAEKANAMKDKQDELDKNTKDLINNFKKLVDAANDQTTTIEEQNKAYSELISTYSDYLSAQDLERENLAHLSQDYEKYQEKIASLRRIEQRESLVAFAQQAFDEDSTALKDIFRVFELFDENFSSMKAFAAMQEWQEAVLNGAMTAQEAFGKLESYLKQFDIPHLMDWDSIVKVASAKGIMDIGNTPFWDRVKGRIKLGFNPYDIIVYEDAYEKLLERLEDIYKMSQQEIEAKKEYKKILDNVNKEAESLAKTEASKISGFEKLNEKDQRGIIEFFKEYYYYQKLLKLKEQQPEAVQNPYVEWQFNSKLAALESRELEKVFKNMQQMLGKLTRDSKLLYKKDNETTDEWVQRITISYNEYGKTIESYSKQTGVVKTVTEDAYENAKKMREAIKMLFGDTIDGDNTEITKLETKLKAIKDVYETYQETLKTASREAALQDATNLASQYKDLFGVDFKAAFAENPAQAISKLIDKVVGESRSALAGFKGVDLMRKLGLDEYYKNIEEETKRTIESIESLFSSYEFQIELESMGLPSDWVSKLFNIQNISLDDIGGAIQSALDQIDKTGGFENLSEKLSNFQDKLRDFKNKEFFKNMREFLEFSKGTLSASVKSQLEATKLLSTAQELQQQGVLSAEQYAERVTAIITKMNGEISKENLKAFKQTPEYILAMGNAYGLSLNRLTDLKGSIEKRLAENAGQMDVEEAKAYVAAVQRLDELIEKKKDAKGGFSIPWLDEAKDILDLQKKLNTLLTNENRTKQQILQKEQQRKDLVSKLNKETDPKKKQEIRDEINETTIDIAELQGQLNSTSAELTSVGEKLEKNANGLVPILAAIQKISSGFANDLQQFDSAFKDVKSWLSGFNDSMDDALDTTGAVLEAALKVGDNIAKVVESYAKKDPVGMVSGIFGIISSIGNLITGLHDKKYSKAIDAEAKAVERLAKAYEKLNQRLQEIYSIDEYNATSTATKENLEEQIRARERMIEAEEDKKKTDHEQIQQWRDENEKDLEQIKDLEDARLKELGGVGGEANYKSVAEDFLDAWIESFLATGDGLAGLDEEFDEFYKNSVKRQMLMRATSGYLEQYMKQVDKYVDKLSANEMTPEEFAKEMEKEANKAAQGADAALRPLAEAFGLDSLLSKEQGTLSAGIQGMSAEQADILAAYWSSSRFLLSTIDNNVRTITERMGINTEVENPMLPQLRLIVQQTMAIRDLFESVVGRGNGGSHGGAYLKVSIG